jgi:hypothetical protein
MADKLIGSLVYGQHETPRKQRPWKDRLKVPVSIGLVLIVIGGLAYKFANYREERQVSQFIQAVQSSNYDAAFAKWDTDGSYTMKDFLTDWGKDAFYTTGMTDAKVVDSNSRGTSVIVYLGANNLKVPVAFRVDKETLKLSYSPTNKYDLNAP